VLELPSNGAERESALRSWAQALTAAHGTSTAMSPATLSGEAADDAAEGRVDG
jgi:hypothetical protein